MDCNVQNSARKETVIRSRSPEAALTILLPIS